MSKQYILTVSCKHDTFVFQEMVTRFPDILIRVMQTLSDDNVNKIEVEKVDV